MFKRNAGRFNHKIILQKPSNPVRDELGGLSSTTYVNAYVMFAMVEQKSQTRQQVLSDQVSVMTRYFVVRDLRQLCPTLDNNWRISYNGYTYIINDITLIEESVPYYIQITATCVNAKGGAV